jgi:hypothetical protein
MILVVTKCMQCPFMRRENNEKCCIIATPPMRPILSDEERPPWCTLRKEQIIVRDFQ